MCIATWIIFFANLTPNILSECAWICMGKVYEPHSIAVLCVKQVGKTTEYLLDRVRIMPQPYSSPAIKGHFTSWSALYDFIF